MFRAKLHPKKGGNPPKKMIKGSCSLEKGTKENNNGKRKQERERSDKREMAPGAAGDTSGCRAKGP